MIQRLVFLMVMLQHSLHHVDKRTSNPVDTITIKSITCSSFITFRLRIAYVEAVGRRNSLNDNFMAQLLNLRVIREQTQLKSTVRDCSTDLVVVDCIFHDLTNINFMNNNYYSSLSL